MVITEKCARETPAALAGGRDSSNTYELISPTASGGGWRAGAEQ